jgi:hypothetical protein
MCHLVGMAAEQQRQRQRKRRPHIKSNTHDVPCVPLDGSNSNNAGPTTTKRVSFDDKVTIHQFRRLMTKTRTTISSSWSWSPMSSNGGSGRCYIGLGRHVQTSVDSLRRMEMTTRTHNRPQQRQPQRLDHRHPRLRLVLPMSSSSSSTTTTRRKPPPAPPVKQQAQVRSRRCPRNDDAAGQHKTAVALAPQHCTETDIVQLAAIQARQGVVVCSSTTQFFCSETTDI